MMMEVKNSTQKLCVIGDPVTHSKSPVIQNTMIHALNLDYLYLCQTVPRGSVAEWLKVAKFAGYAGFNATMPHKLELVPLLDELDEDAKLFGAVNTVCIREGKTYGYNTDGAGFINSLTAEGISVTGKTIVILGAGGAAKAVALKLSQSGAKKVTVCNRSLDKAQALCDLDANAVLSPASFDDATLCEVVRDCHLLVNCTSLGMEGTGLQFSSFEFLEGLPEKATVCDLIYHPAETELLRQAYIMGNKTMNGMGLLVHQAVLALEHFTQTEIDAKTMLPLIETALQS